MRLYSFYGVRLLVMLLLLFHFNGVFAQTAMNNVTTTVHIDVCGDGLVTGNEVCDGGLGNNTGAYSSSTASRHCNATCSAWGPYCGDGILQPQYGEECDDGNNTSGDRCSADCHIENLPNSGGGGGGAGSFSSYTPPPLTQVIIAGKAYPQANVHILKDGADIGIVLADAKADFYFSTTNVSPGTATFGFWAQDSSGLKSAALNTTLSVISGAVTTISGAFLPPTIDSDKRKVSRGGTITFFGQSPPQVTVVTHINSDEEFLQNATSDENGGWKASINTNQLADEDFHTAKSLFETKIGENTVQSAFSQSITFYVGKKAIGTKFIADLNGDGRVNLVDFSMLLFYWGTSGPIGDLNGDHKVDLTDFSILLFNWTG